MPTFWVPRAVLPGGAASGVRIEVSGGRIGSVTTGAESPHPDDVVLRGTALPGLVSAHSHAFHRALRGRTHDGGGTFWTWRERMYEVSAALEPASYFKLARALFSEMLLAGYTTVGEFHYLHHRPGGRPYDDPNAMGLALIAAAREVGIRLTLLDTAYLRGGLSDDGAPLPLSAEQERFSDGTFEAWVVRHRALRLALDDMVEVSDDYAFADSAPGVASTAGDSIRLGMAAHSLRALDALTAYAMRTEFPHEVMHAHVSEQPLENRQVEAAEGRRPVDLLDDFEILGPLFTAVHATHLTDREVRMLGASRSNVSFCPTTERDLADGVGPGSALLAAGASLCLGSDQNAVVDPFEEVRGLELDERLVTGQRGRFTPAELLHSASAAGYASLGWSDGGTLAAGSLADFVVVDDSSVRTAGGESLQLPLVATSADVTDVVVAGSHVVRDRVVAAGSRTASDVGRELASSIAALVEGSAS
ncbi:amidohydrolase family protein [Frondihabitans australicus]|uniref:Formiminoglutamate deiminase n=1 Tax=Frondihabitans australicus TaxID=386892 RepID=A0A495IL43_9MICO|nr:amidohydrolase family protein [Frondihabitans australicus]RKR76489.1 formiminoglutamate deiminase [Frondihabitans australicus]